jgi:5-methylcytosine-specific restriction protein A
MSWYSMNGPGDNGIVKNPNWAWDEIVLVCDLVAQNGWRRLTTGDPRVAELSGLLRELPLHPVNVRRADFRNLDGVALKSVNIATAHPGYRGPPTNCSATDREVVAEFIARPHEMRAQAHALREAALRGDLRSLASAVDEEEMAATEGRLAGKSLASASTASSQVGQRRTLGRLRSRRESTVIGCPPACGPARLT